MKTKKTVVRSAKDIPRSMTNDEAATFFATAEMGPEAFVNAPDPLQGLTIQRSSTIPITVKLERDMKARLERLALLKHMPYQTLLKSFVSDRLYEEEKRLGIV